MPRHGNRPRRSFALQNPITYNEAKQTWFIPIDLLLNRSSGESHELGLGGAWRIGNSKDPSFRCVVDARLIVHF